MANGAKELVLIAQDTSRYGIDLYGEYSLAKLMHRLCRIDGLRWLRVLYCYPDSITDELLDTMAQEEKIVNYIDLPLQHASGPILRAMNRRGDRQSLTALMKKIRERVPGVVLRTTLITGFPGETEEDFTELAEFVKDVKFERLGCFAYSQEEGTPRRGAPRPAGRGSKSPTGPSSSWTARWRSWSARAWSSSARPWRCWWRATTATRSAGSALLAGRPRRGREDLLHHRGQAPPPGLLRPGEGGGLHGLRPHRPPGVRRPPMKMNLPNKLTILRIVMVPFFVFFLLADFVPHRYLFALILFCAASLHRPPGRQNRPPGQPHHQLRQAHGPPRR